MWSWSIVPLSNVPFWSLSYEFWFYAIFGAAFFLRGSVRVLTLLAVTFIAGPKILTLLPIWLLGTGTYWLVSRSRVSSAVAWLAALVPVALILTLHEIGARSKAIGLTRRTLGHSVFDALNYSQEFLYMSVVAVLIAIHFIGVANLERQFSPILSKVERPIRSVATLTFAIYLFHYPLLHLWSAIVQPRTFAGSLTVILLTLAVIIPLGFITERLRDVWRKHGGLRLHLGKDNTSSKQAAAHVPSER